MRQVTDAHGQPNGIFSAVKTLFKSRYVMVVVGMAAVLGGMLIGGGVVLGLLQSADSHEHWEEFTFEQAVQRVAREPRSVDAHAVMAMHWQHRGRFDRAVEEWLNAAHLDPTDCGIHESLAEALQRLGRTSEAQLQWRIVARLAPAGSWQADQAKVKLEH